jgi:N-acetylglucosaminyl-diphospho-decaprenol L-rhamnosyltransferase
MSDVAVSIVNANSRDELLACLDSLRVADADIVVLDNASDDGSVEAVRARFPDVRVIAQQQRAGFGANHNAIIRAVEHPYVFVLNPDTRVPPETIPALTAYLDSHSNVAVVGPQLRGFDGGQQGSAWRLMSVPVQLVWACTLGRRGAVVSRGPAPRRVGAVSASAMMLRREAVVQAGLFDESYFMFSEEADLARRLGPLGFEIHYVPTVHVLHKGQETTARWPERQVNEVWRSLDLYTSRYHGRFEAHVLKWLTGLGYALASVVASAAPRSLRPAAWNPAVYRLHTRNAFRGTRDPGLRELAEEWNTGQSQTETPRRLSSRRARG